MEIKTVHCLFEQSGTFKNEFKKLGINAIDYDILNDFNQTDNQIDLYNEINKSYGGGYSIFDNIKEDDLIIAFFPCIRFEAQILLWFRGEAMQQKKWNDLKKLEYDLKIHNELCENYALITKLAIICLRKNLKLIIENPNSEQHYLTRYWCLKSKIKDNNRWLSGDWEIKPTQYWFINCEPENNLVMDEAINLKKRKRHNDLAFSSAERSMISNDYARRFIREFII